MCQYRIWAREPDFTFLEQQLDNSLCVNTEFGQGNPISHPLNNNQPFLNFNYYGTRLGDPDSISIAHVNNFFSHFISADAEGRGIDSLRPHTFTLIKFPLLSFSFSLLVEGLWDLFPTAHFLYTFSSHSQPSYRTWVRIPLLSFI